ncbi:MAG: ATP-dependent dethiobiotin synthetase BioD [Jatrophihabitans sp.]|nr:MAG: ATP-dependent dethiobiotin synthetase BioD [Jatrophihabitans sp.]
MSVLVVTGTGTDVGKTVATAAVAACAAGAVAVVKPAQTGLAPGEPGDLAEVLRLAGCADVHEYARFPDPLSPAAAARRSGLADLDRDDVLGRIAALDATHDLVLVEGAGGLLVEMSRDGWTLRDLLGDLGAPALVVTEPGLGTLNATALTLEALHAGSIDVAGIVIGRWPSAPDLACWCNVHDLAGLARLVGVLPDGLAQVTDFPRRAAAALAPALGGTFDVSAFRRLAHQEEQTWPTSSR